jgi:hypothetical protein
VILNKIDARNQSQVGGQTWKRGDDRYVDGKAQIAQLVLGGAFVVWAANEGPALLGELDSYRLSGLFGRGVSAEYVSTRLGKCGDSDNPAQWGE